MESGSKKKSMQKQRKSPVNISTNVQLTEMSKEGKEVKGISRRKSTPEIVFKRGEEK